MATATRSKARRQAKPARQRKLGRVEVRLTREQKMLVEQASAIKGVTVSSFITQSVLEDAKAAIEDERVFVLNAEQSRIVAELLINPPAPNEALLLAAKDYREGRLRPGF